MGDCEREALRQNPGMLDRHLALCQHRFERGEFPFAVQALRLCISFGHPLPDWLGDHVVQAMRFFGERGGANGRGKRGGHAVRTRNAQIDVERFRIAEREMAKGATRDAAFERASMELRSTDARGSPAAIKKSHAKIAKLYPRPARKSGPKQGMV